jgi:hypothetical protein
MITNLQKSLGGTNLKRYYSVFILGIGLCIIYLLLFSPFNVYQWANAKNIVISSPYIIGGEEPMSPHFEEYIGHKEDIVTVKYLGRNSYFVSFAQGKQCIIFIEKGPSATIYQLFESDGKVRARTHGLR